MTPAAQTQTSSLSSRTDRTATSLSTPNIHTPQASNTTKTSTSAGSINNATSTINSATKGLKDDQEEKRDLNKAMDLVIPSSLLTKGGNNTGNGCTVLVQVDPKDASALDFHDASGAVGRFEANEEEVRIDLKGFQYVGTLQSGPTALVVSMHPKNR